MLYRPENIATTEKNNTLPEEFLVFTQDPNSLTSKAANLLSVDPKDFINWRWQMRKQIRTSDEFAPFLDLLSQENEGFEHGKGLFNAGVTPYYAGLACIQTDIHKSLSLRLQSIPRKEETLDLFGLKDPLQEVAHSPVPEIVHVYPDRVAFCVAMLCPVYCRYCYRKRRDDEEGLHYNRAIIKRGLDYIAKTPAIKDVLITGGDPFIASDATIENLLQQLRSIPHVEIIRFGTRTPVTLPYRVTAKLAKIISRYHPVWVNTHFNCSEELIPEAIQAIANLTDQGIPVGNQAVLLRGVNDSNEKMLNLCRALIRNRVRPYYVFHPHLIAGTEHLRVSIKRGMEIMKSLRGKISGFGIPSYILDTPSGKIPITHNHILGFDGDDLLVEDLNGAIWREKGAARQEWQEDY